MDGILIKLNMIAMLSTGDTVDQCTVIKLKLRSILPMQSHAKATIGRKALKNQTQATKIKNYFNEVDLISLNHLYKHMPSGSD